ncbi:PREDICTED: uncharacterized protein LOC109238114 [Nicotiana attenuata]|uniref:uncharacterized protein LOC109238114 n=1 Tax=Nicotiana attenuata TaxID=49451 RepID=UPI0009058689|nr:PREDICTED: uncharacterized protein LOC109238114 [Nicotiana attenuata]
MNQQFEALNANNTWSMVPLPADDVIVTGNHLEEIDSLKNFLHETFINKRFGKVTLLLGMKVLHKEDGVLITQRKFTMDLLKEFEGTEYTSLSSPLDPSTKLKAEESPLLPDPYNYRKMIGKLNFLKNTRKVLHKEDGVLITQRKFTMDLLKEFEGIEYTSLSSPLDPSTKLKAEESPLLPDPYNYRKMIGKLNFLKNTRLDISYSVQHLKLVHAVT